MKVVEFEEHMVLTHFSHGENKNSHLSEKWLLQNGYEPRFFFVAKNDFLTRVYSRTFLARQKNIMILLRLPA